MEKIEQTINDFEKQTLLNLQHSLIKGGRSWNEVELENKFISPVIMTAAIDDDEISYFLERPLSAVIGDYELSGIVGGMIASGIVTHTPLIFVCTNTNAILKFKAHPKHKY